MAIRYDDMRIDRLLIKEYQKQLEDSLKSVGGLNDIEVLLADFERKFAAYIGTRHAFAVNSGTDALQLSLLAAGIGKGDSVIIPDVTYPSVPLSVLYAGAEPVIVDVNADDLQMDAKEAAKAIRKDTKAIIAVHMFSRACDLEALGDLAKRKGLKLIEDCCQAESSQFKGRKLGGFGDLACFSFSYYKPLSSCGGGGGMVCFSDDGYRRVADFTRIWDDHVVLAQAGKRFSRMYFMDLVSLQVKFRYLKEIIKTRMKAKAIYEQGLEGVKGISFFKDKEGVVSVPQNFVVYCQKRDALGAVLRKKGVVWQEPYTPLHMMKVFSPYAAGEYPQSEKYAAQAIQLPLFSFMKTQEAEEVVDAVKGSLS